jgi:hypothetical protein
MVMIEYLKGTPFFDGAIVNQVKQACALKNDKKRVAA